MSFRCLLRQRVLHYIPPTAAKIINTCAVLHNMAIIDREGDPEAVELLWENNNDFGLFDNGPVDENLYQPIGHVNRELVAGQLL